MFPRLHVSVKTASILRRLTAVSDLDSRYVNIFQIILSGTENVYTNLLHAV